VTALVIGASSGLGRALANQLALHKHDLLLVASDVRDLEALAADLMLRNDVAVHTLALDLGRETDPGVRIAAALDAMPPLCALLLPIGASREDDDFSLDASRIGQLLAINLHAPLAIVHALLPKLLESRGVIVLFGSIAAVRGRGRNVVYATTLCTRQRSVASNRCMRACVNAIARGSCACICTGLDSSPRT
jgi:short-subunit dehydrogenase